MIGYPRYETKMVKKLVFLSTRGSSVFLELLWIERQLVKKTSKPQRFILDPVKRLWGSIFVKLVNISLKLGNYCKKNPSILTMTVPLNTPSGSELFYIESFIEQKIIDDHISNSSLKPQIITK